MHRVMSQQGPMSPHTVVAMLLASFSPNSTERKEAEQQIAALTQVPGSLSVLLRIAAEVRHRQRQETPTIAADIGAT